MMKIGLDIDGVVVSEYSRKFSILVSALMKSPDIEIFIISSRENSNKSKKETEQELKELGILYDHLILTDNKQIKQKAIKDMDMFADNEIENFIGINPDTCCLLVRESMNYCWETDRFLGSKRTVEMID